MASQYFNFHNDLDLIFKHYNKVENIVNDQPKLQAQKDKITNNHYLDEYEKEQKIDLLDKIINKQVDLFSIKNFNISIEVGEEMLLIHENTDFNKNELLLSKIGSKISLDPQYLQYFHTLQDDVPELQFQLKKYVEESDTSAYTQFDIYLKFTNTSSTDIPVKELDDLLKVQGILAHIVTQKFTEIQQVRDEYNDKKPSGYPELKIIQVDQIKIEPYINQLDQIVNSGDQYFENQLTFQKDTSQYIPTTSNQLENKNVYSKDLFKYHLEQINPIQLVNLTSNMKILNKFEEKWLVQFEAQVMYDTTFLCFHELFKHYIDTSQLYGQLHNSTLNEYCTLLDIYLKQSVQLEKQQDQIEQEEKIKETSQEKIESLKQYKKQDIQFTIGPLRASNPFAALGIIDAAFDIVMRLDKYLEKQLKILKQIIIQVPKDQSDLEYYIQGELVKQKLDSSGNPLENPPFIVTGQLKQIPKILPVIFQDRDSDQKISNVKAFKITFEKVVYQYQITSFRIDVEHDQFFKEIEKHPTQPGYDIFQKQKHKFGSLLLVAYHQSQNNYLTQFNYPFRLSKTSGEFLSKTDPQQHIRFPFEDNSNYLKLAFYMQV